MGALPPDTLTIICLNPVVMELNRILDLPPEHTLSFSLSNLRRQDTPEPVRYKMPEGVVRSRAIVRPHPAPRFRALAVDYSPSRRPRRRALRSMSLRVRSHP